MMKGRALSDAEKISGGAEYVFDLGTKEPRLEFTDDQIGEAQQEMGEYLRKKIEVSPRATVREIIIIVLRNLGVEFNEKDVDLIESKIKSVKNPKNISSLAYIVTRNWGISKYRKKEAAERANKEALLKQADKLLEAEKEKKEREEFELAKSEFWRLADELAASKPQARIKEMMAEFYDHFFNGLTEDEFVNKYPSSNEPLLRQHCHRARMHLSNHEGTSSLFKKVIWDPKYREYGRASR